MIERKYFGETQNGDIVSKFLLENKSGMQVEVSDLGALILAISIIDKEGIKRDVALGFEKVEDYFDTETGMGAYVGRNANRIKGADDSGEYVEFHRVSPHLEQGFPGDLEQTIRYTLTKNNELMIDYVMSSDKTTIVNPTNHTYFNLDGHSIWPECYCKYHGSEYHIGSGNKDTGKGFQYTEKWINLSA